MSVPKYARLCKIIMLTVYTASVIIAPAAIVNNTITTILAFAGFIACEKIYDKIKF